MSSRRRERQPLRYVKRRVLDRVLGEFKHAIDICQVSKQGAGRSGGKDHKYWSGNGALEIIESARCQAADLADAYRNRR